MQLDPRDPLRRHKLHPRPLALVDVLARAGVEIDRDPALAGCLAAQASFAAWASFERERARSEAALAARLNRAWSPLSALLSLVPEE